MRHRKKAQQLKSHSSYHRAMWRNMAVSLILHEQIKTTHTRAKYLRVVVEKLITTAKKDNLTAKRKLFNYLPKEGAVRKLIEELGPRYKTRPGGYTQTLRIGLRKGDGAPMAQIKFV